MCQALAKHIYILYLFYSARSPMVFVAAPILQMRNGGPERSSTYAKVTCLVRGAALLTLNPFLEGREEGPPREDTCALY